MSVAIVLVVVCVILIIARHQWRARSERRWRAALDRYVERDAANASYLRRTFDAVNQKKAR